MEYQGLPGKAGGFVVTRSAPVPMCELREAAARISLFLSQGALHERYVFDEHALDVAPSSAQEECGGLAGDAGDMRSEEDTARGVTGELKERVIRRRRLVRIDIDGGTAEMAGIERIRNGGLIQDAAAGGLTEDGSGFRCS